MSYVEALSVMLVIYRRIAGRCARPVEAALVMDMSTLLEAVSHGKCVSPTAFNFGLIPSLPTGRVFWMGLPLVAQPLDVGVLPYFDEGP